MLSPLDSEKRPELFHIKKISSCEFPFPVLFSLNKYISKIIQGLEETPQRIPVFTQKSLRKQLWLSEFPGTDIPQAGGSARTNHYPKVSATTGSKSPWEARIQFLSSPEKKSKAHGRWVTCHWFCKWLNWARGSDLSDAVDSKVHGSTWRGTASHSSGSFSVNRGLGINKMISKISLGTYSV